MISLLLTLLVMTVCLYYGVLYEDVGLITALFVIGILALVAVMEIIWRMVTFRCYSQIPIGMAEIGRPLEILIKTRNKGLLPVGKVRVRISITNVLTREKETEWQTIPGIPFGQGQFVVKVTMAAAGAYEVRIERVRIYGLTGFISFTKRSKDLSTFCILPEVHSMGIEVKDSTKNFRGDADVFDDFRSGEDPSETFEIREYREKDKLQNIHWKLSAKMDDLMVKENSLPRPCSIVLMADASSKSKNKDAAEVFLELLASISFRLMDLKTPHFVTWLSRETGDVRRIRVDNEESYYMFLNYFMKDMDAKQQKDIRKEYRQKYRNEIYLHDVVISSGLEIYKDGELFTKWNLKNIKSVEDECSKVELLL